MLSPSRLVEVVDELNERADALRNGSFVTVGYHAHSWFATVHFLDIRGRGDTMEEAIDGLAKALTDRERRDAGVAKTIGIEVHA